ncbi:MAG TPA: lipase family protein [Mycobacteriales bacterium]
MTRFGSRRTWLGLSAAAVAVLGFATAGPAVAATTPSTATSVTPPTADPFYAQPANLGAVAPGTVLRSRQVAVPPATTGFATAAYQLLYRTTSATGRPVATVTTLLLPTAPRPGVRDLVSYQTAEDSLSLDCAPSYTLRTGSNDEVDAIDPLLTAGWDVVVPDYEGPQSEYAVGTLAGRATLDSIRAVEHFVPAGLSTSTPVGLMGYSGGSIPSTWANALAPSYAPELNIVAATAGGIAADPATVLASENGGVAFGEIMGAGIGIDRAYPQFGLDGLLNAKGKALEHTDETGGCGGFVTNAPFGTVAEYTNYATPQEMLAVPRVKNTIAKLNLIPRPAPTAPTFYFQEIADEFLPHAQVDQLVAAYCAKGATIDYVRGVTGEHLSGAVDYSTQAFAYFQSRFAGLPPVDTCALPGHGTPG